MEWGVLSCVLFCGHVSRVGESAWPTQREGRGWFDVAMHGGELWCKRCH